MADARPDASEKLESLDDIELMRLASEGRLEPFACLVRRHQRPLLNFFLRLGARTEAEDLVQETFVRVFRFRRRYRPRAKFTTFLYTVARHVRIDALRRLKRSQELLLRAREEMDASSDGAMSATRARIDAGELVRRLPEKLKDVVVLSVYQGLAYEQIAGILRIPVGTVKSRMFLAMERLRAMLDEERTDT